MATVSLQATYDQARRLLESGDTERAVAVTQHILQDFPRNLESQRLLGEAYLTQRYLEQAQSAFQTVLDSDPENIPAYVGLGITHERQGDLDKAIQSFEHALEIKPDMPELRSQLLRLYTETWGSDGAQLRLSRAGLARLYAKGHMLPQAIQEFHSVIDDQPDRLDARVALAEVLWRDGQEEAAIAACEDILHDYPYALKPNLLLGYLSMAAGDPQGEGYWNRGLELDPYQTVARAMFDQLPYATPSQPTLAEWNEQEWQSAVSASNEPEQAPNEPQPQNEPIAATTGAVAAATTDDDFFGGSWMETIDQEPQESLADASAGADDDFLERLLAFDGLRGDAVAQDVATTSEPLEPFSREEPSAADQRPDNDDFESPTDERQTTQFSLAELGLTEEDMAPVQHQQSSAATETPTSTQDTDDTLTPFSLSDLGLSDDEIAALNPDEATDQAEEDSPSGTTDDEPDLTPFSFSDLGLSDDEIAALNLDQATDQAATSASAQHADAEETAIAPFSFDDVDFGSQHATETPTEKSEALPAPEQIDEQPPAKSSAAEIDEEPDFTPFSLADLGLSEEEIAQFNNEAQPTANTNDDLDDVKPFSMDDWSFNEASVQQDSTDDDESYELPDELQPFSLDDLDITTSSGQRGLEAGTLPSSLQPFSLDDVSNIARSEEGASDILPTSFGEDEEAAAQTGGYSFRQAPSKANTNFGREQQEPDAAGRTSIFAKLQQRHSELPTEEPPPLAPVADDEMDMSLFGGEDNVSLRDYEAALPTAPAENDVQPAEPVEVTDDEPDLTPFSLSDLGLSDDEIAALNLDQGISQTETPAPVEVTDDEPDLTPFSLSDLGLSDDEIAALGLDQATETPSPNNQMIADEPFVQDAGSDVQQNGLANDSSDQEDVVFDFDMLGEQPKALTPRGQEESFDDSIRPFSLDDLGLTDDEASPFDSSIGSELGLTEEELADMDLGALEHNNPAMAHQDAISEQYQIDTGDPVLDHLITIGHTRGFVDLDDIIRAVENPEEESDRIEEIGQVLHRAGIQIRDGDEIIDMDEEAEEDEEAYATYAEVEADEVAAPFVTSSEEPDLTPFSLSDLGLSPEEIASLGLDETPAEPSTVAETPADGGVEAATPASDEPDLTPFSLSDLGLSPEEIASLDLDETPAEQSSTVAGTPADGGVEAATPASDEPDLTPFSLSDLGLSPEEIASLGLDETTPVVETTAQTDAASDDEDTFDFSVADAARNEVAPTPSQPRVREEEPPPPLSPEDAAFVPKALDELDSIWDSVSAQPTTFYTPPTAETTPAAQLEPAPTLPPVSERIVRVEKIQRPVENREPERRAPEPPKAATPPTPTPVREPQGTPNSAPRSGRPAPWQQRQSPTAFIPTGDTSLDEYLRQLETEPDNTPLRVAVARISGQTERFDLALQQYKTLIKGGNALDEVSDDLQELIEDTNDQSVLSKLYRLLGDVYTKQNRFRDAVEAYSWTFTK